MLNYIGIINANIFKQDIRDSGDLLTNVSKFLKLVENQDVEVI